MMTFALLTKTLLPSRVIVRLAPPSVGTMVPFMSVELYATVPLTTTPHISTTMTSHHANQHAAGYKTIVSLTVILENRSKLHNAQIRRRRANSIKSIVTRHKNRNISHLIECSGEVRLREGASSSSETGGDCCGGDILREGEDGVDDVDDAAGEGDVLGSHGVG